MNLELKNIKCIASMSEETHCFSANLYVDGHKVAEISNHGHGGSDNVRWLNLGIKDKVKAYFAAMPEAPTPWNTTLQPDLEIWCGEQLNEWHRRKAAKKFVKMCATKVIGLDLKTGNLLTYKVPPRAVDQVSPSAKVTYRALIEKRDNVVLLNGMVEAHVYNLLEKTA